MDISEHNITNKDCTYSFHNFHEKLTKILLYIFYFVDIFLNPIFKTRALFRSARSGSRFMSIYQSEQGGGLKEGKWTLVKGVHG